MKTWARMGRFGVVGGMGMAVQLGALAALSRVLPGHYLVATALAIELAVLHNFMWHVRYTWGDRAGGAVLPRLVRFHVSNGLVSLVGNLLLMRVLVGVLPVVAANALAIGCCSVVNFGAAHVWAFRGRVRVVEA